MTVKKLAGGPVYDYLIRQVAVQDAQVPAGGLTSYYSEKGEAPGTWIGAGLDGLGMSAGEIVTEAQMNHLFGTGEHPNADQLRAAAAAAGLSSAEVEAAGRLGATFRKREPVRNEFAEELLARCRAWNAAAGRPVRAKLPRGREGCAADPGGAGSASCVPTAGSRWARPNCLARSPVGRRSRRSRWPATTRCSPHRSRSRRCGRWRTRRSPR